eukprot:jgi/Galph1/2973/GphlegSOOS_G1638.1
MVQLLTKDGIALLRETRQLKGQSIQPTEAPILVVVEIHRYLQDHSFFEQLGLEQHPEENTSAMESSTNLSYVSNTSPQRPQQYSVTNTTQQQIMDLKVPAYDLVISDGTHLSKCVLSPLLNGLVHYGWLCIGTYLKLKQYEWRENEFRAPPVTFMVMLELSILQIGQVPDTNLLSFPQDATPYERKEQPLAGRRLYYLALNNDDCITTDHSIKRSDLIVSGLNHWKDVPKSVSAVLTEHEKLASYPLMGRVVRKFSCLHFGRRESEQKYPIKFDLCLADNVQTVNVVIWHSLYFRYYHCIYLDDIIVIDSYRIRQKDNSVEIHLNPSNPTGKNLYWMINRCPLNWSSWIDLRNQANNSLCDVMGRVHKVFPILRYRPTQEYRFYERRWILLRDLESPVDIPVLLYSCSQPRSFYSLHSGKPLFITDCQVCRVGNPEQNSFYLRTTFSSQFVDHPEIMKEWAKNHPYSPCLEVLQNPMENLDNVHCFSSYTRTRDKPDWLPSRDAILEYLNSFSEVYHRAALLHFGECKQFLFQGMIKRIRWRYRKGSLPLAVGKYPSYLPPCVQEHHMEQEEANDKMLEETDKEGELEYLLELEDTKQEYLLVVICRKMEYTRAYRKKGALFLKASNCSRILLEMIDDECLAGCVTSEMVYHWKTPEQVANRLTEWMQSKPMIFEVQAMRWHPSLTVPPVTLHGVVLTLMAVYNAT